jgi:hypothetical protein
MSYIDTVRVRFVWWERARWAWADARGWLTGEGYGGGHRPRGGTRVFYGPNAARKAARDRRGQPTSPRNSPIVPR